MTAFIVSLCIVGAVFATAIVHALRRYGFLRFEVRIPDPEAGPEADDVQAPEPTLPPKDSRPPWLLELEALGFQTFETTDPSIVASAPRTEYFICVGTPHPYNVCGGCGTRNVRMLGETPMGAETGSARIFWIGSVCGRCGGVDLTSPNAPRFLNLLLADSRSMLTMIHQARPHADKPFNEMVTAMLEQNEGVLQARINRSAALRAALPAEKMAKVLLFQKGRRPRRRRKDLF